MVRGKDIAAILAIVCGISLFGNWIAVKIDPVKSLPGMLILGLISFAGWGLAQALPWKLPNIVYISLIAIALTTPWTPGSAWVVSQVNNVNFLALCTPILAYAGIAIGKDLDQGTGLRPETGREKGRGRQVGGVFCGQKSVESGCLPRR